MEKKIKKLKLNVETLNIIKDVDQSKIIGGRGGEISETGLGPLWDCEPANYSIWACTLTEASGCVTCLPAAP